MYVLLYVIFVCFPLFYHKLPRVPFNALDAAFLSQSMPSPYIQNTSMHMLGSWKPLEVHGCDIHGHLHLNVMWPSMDILYPYALFLFGRSGDIKKLGVPLQACFLEILNGIGTESILPLLASTQIAPF
jgi:hypothetical protein